MKKMLKKVAIVMTSISLLNYTKIVLADQFDDWQTTVIDTMADFDQTDSNTAEFIPYIQDSYYDVKALDELHHIILDHKKLDVICFGVEILDENGKTANGSSAGFF